MNYALLTDANGDIYPELAEKMGIEVVPMAFSLDGQDYLNYIDNREMSPKDFYAALRQEKKVTTSAINPAQWADYMRPILEADKDLLVVAFSSGLSTTYNSAVIASMDLQEEFPTRQILVVDSLCAAMGEGLFTYMVWEKIQSGATLKEAYDYAEETKLHIIHWFTVDDLQFLKRGGRISGAAAAVGTMLSVKPILRVTNEGKLTSHSKARGRKASLNALVAKMEESAIDPTKHVAYISHGDCLEDALYVKEQIMTSLGVPDVFLNYVGPPVGCHAGPGTLALGFYGKER
ncbi:MAG: DegV family protein [Eubacteriales bacterium]